ncbi:MAG: hypothetical protein K6T85_06510, partial [Gorillibacterium sp.]|nr:hypothetical protein [Gorillibacterium sp.]
MGRRHAVVLVFAPNRTGEQFVQALSDGDKSFAVMACSSAEQLYLDKLGLKSIVQVNIKEKSLMLPPENEYSKV